MQKKLHVAIWACIEYSIVRINIHPWSEDLENRPLEYNLQTRKFRGVQLKKKAKMFYGLLLCDFLPGEAQTSEIVIVLKR